MYSYPGNCFLSIGPTDIYKSWLGAPSARDEMLTRRLQALDPFFFFPPLLAKIMVSSFKALSCLWALAVSISLSYLQYLVSCI